MSTLILRNSEGKIIKEIPFDKNQTNEEWFDSLPTEEKADWLEGLIIYCFGVGHITESEQEKYGNVVDDVEVWLKQPHTNE